jgi:hypothetical protein
MQQCRSNEYVKEAMLMTRKLAKTWGLTKGDDVFHLDVGCRWGDEVYES